VISVAEEDTTFDPVSANSSQEAATAGSTASSFGSDAGVVRVRGTKAVHTDFLLLLTNLVRKTGERTKEIDLPLFLLDLVVPQLCNVEADGRAHS
jgi:hypothetical protein